jgi:hypothetical protein
MSSKKKSAKNHSATNERCYSRGGVGLDLLLDFSELIVVSGNVMDFQVLAALLRDINSVGTSDDFAVGSFVGATVPDPLLPLPLSYPLLPLPLSYPLLPLSYFALDDESDVVEYM